MEKGGYLIVKRNNFEKKFDIFNGIVYFILSIKKIIKILFI